MYPQNNSARDGSSGPEQTGTPFTNMVDFNPSRDKKLHAS